MKLVVGLGNPGLAYINTRHNAGFLVADQLLLSKLPKDVVIKKSDVFMNESGVFVKRLVDKYQLELSNLYVIHDDLDLKLGEYKIQFEHGPKEHNGIKSINDELGSDAYWHVRVGIDNRDPDNRASGEEFVLQNFTDDERQILDKVIQTLCKKLETSLVNTN